MKVIYKYMLLGPKMREPHSNHFVHLSTLSYNMIAKKIFNKRKVQLLRVAEIALFRLQSNSNVWIDVVCESACQAHLG